MSDVSKFTLDNTDINVKDTFARAPTFAMSNNRVNISNGETTSTMFGKIAKWFNDLKSVAFSGSYNDLLNKPTDNIKITKLYTYDTQGTPQRASNLTLNESLANYDFYFINYRLDYGTDTTSMTTGILPINSPCELMGLQTGDTPLLLRRICTPNGNTLSISDCLYYATLNANGGAYNGGCIVSGVYGVKRG